MVTFNVVPAQWQSSFNSINIDLGYTTSARRVRDHRKLRRQEVSNSNLTLPSITQAVPTPVDSAAPTSTRLDLATTITNRLLPLPSGAPIDVTCIECSIEGSIDFVSAGFEIRGSSLSNIVPDLVGSASITAHGVKAHIKLSTNVRKSWQFMSELFLASTTSIRIPGIGAASIRYGPFLTGGFNQNGTLALTEYGFDMEVCTRSKHDFIAKLK